MLARLDNLSCEILHQSRAAQASSSLGRYLLMCMALMSGGGGGNSSSSVGGSDVITTFLTS